MTVLIFQRVNCDVLCLKMARVMNIQMNMNENYWIYSYLQSVCNELINKGQTVMWPNLRQRGKCFCVATSPTTGTNTMHTQQLISWLHQGFLFFFFLPGFILLYQTPRPPFHLASWFSWASTGLAQTGRKFSRNLALPHYLTTVA